VDIMVNEQERLRKAILDMVSAAPERRLTPHDLGRARARELEVSRHAVQEAVKNLVQEGHLRFTYHDPTSYVEVPHPASWLEVPY
jgi:DNA-binding GntR family transcriptional regulator